MSSTRRGLGTYENSPTKPIFYQDDCWIWPATMMHSEAITSHNGHGAFLFAEGPSQGISVTNTIQSRLPVYGAAPVAKRLAEATGGV